MLDNLFAHGMLFAQRNALGRLPAPPVGSSVAMLVGFGLVSLVVMALVVALVQYRQRRNAKGALNSPTELWAELCRVHQLDKSDSVALRDLAEARAMEPLASVFVRADLWQLERDTPEIRHLHSQLQRLQAVLFAGSEKRPITVKLSAG